jgi:dihydrofolate reductase
MIYAIVAVDSNWGIGFQGQVLERIPEDMKYFKDLTINKTVIMGRKTWDGLQAKPLYDRNNIILSTTYPEGTWAYGDNHYVRFTPEMTEQEWEAFKTGSDDIFIIGGGQVYEQLLPLCDKIYITKIEKEYDYVDTYFPNLDKDPNWEVSTCTELKEYNNIYYAFLTYDRIS